MIDLNTSPSAPVTGEHSKLKNLMERTPGIGVLKTKFLTVLGNSNELLNGISNKFTLNISSSDSEYYDEEDDHIPTFDETIDYTKIDFESRRVKARRAHEEIISGRYRQPNLVSRTCHEDVYTAGMGKVKNPPFSSASSSSTSSSSSSCSLSTHALDRSQVSSTTCSNSIESRHSGGYGRPGRVIAGARRSDLDIQRDLTNNIDFMNPGVIHTTVDREHAEKSHHDVYLMAAPSAATTSAEAIGILTRSRKSNSSTLTSLHDEPGALVSPSIESTDWKNFIRSESLNSVPSWASSISLDCHSDEEPVKEFMKRFTDVLFAKPDAIDFELKSQFGQMAHLDVGRQWFTRLLLEHKLKSNRVDELIFHSLVQYFSIVLFECGEYEDFAPAAVIMSLCFLFYYEIDVPGCDPYREYIFTYMRQQPIWHLVRFWNAAFIDAVENEREQRLAAKMKRLDAREKKKKNQGLTHLDPLPIMEASGCAKEPLRKLQSTSVDTNLPLEDSDVSSSSSSHPNSAKIASLHAANMGVEKKLLSEMQTQENAACRQLGVFTCNMHCLGVPQSLCLEFLKKQSISLNIAKDKVNPIKENIQRIYHETDMWGAKEF